MSLFRGSLTFVRFFVDGDAPSDLLSHGLGKIKRKIQRPLAAEDDEPERSGWCKVGEAFELEPTHDDVFYNEFVNVGFRTDKWAIPGALLKSKLAEAERAYLQKKGKERLSRQEKNELKELVSRRLRKNLVPQVRLCDVSWNTSEGIVRFFGTSPKAHLAFVELFEKTFGVKLVREAPYTLGARLGLTKAQERALSDAEPLVLSEEEDDEDEDDDLSFDEDD